MKKFHSTGLFDSKKPVKDENVAKEIIEIKIKKNEQKPRSKTPISRNNHTTTANNTVDKDKSSKAITDKNNYKKVVNMTTEAVKTESVKGEKFSPKVKKKLI